MRKIFAMIVKVKNSPTFACELLAVLYNGQADKIDQLVPFLKTALEHDQKCLYWFVNPRDRDDLDEAFKRLGLSLDYYLTADQLQLVSAADSGFPDFPDRLEAEAAEGLEKGYDRQLIFRDLAGRLKDQGIGDEILAGQERLESLQLPIATRVCHLYDRQSSPPERLRDRTRFPRTRASERRWFRAAW